MRAPSPAPRGTPRAIPRTHRLGLLALLALLGGGCTTLAEVSAGQTGCAPEEIVVTDENSSWGARTWTATCNGTPYQCSAHGGGENSTPQVSCAPKRGATTPGGSQAAPAEPATDGCQYDTQCKGDRICEAGQCVSPAPQAPAAAAPAQPFPPAEPAPAAPSSPQPPSADPASS